MPIQLKRKNGQITPYRNSEYIPAYLFLPKELVERAPPELQLPRRIDAYFTDWNVIRAVESDLFLELMMDSYAYMVWNHLGFKDSWRPTRVMRRNTLLRIPADTGCRSCWTAVSFPRLRRCIAVPGT